MESSREPGAERSSSLSNRSFAFPQLSHRVVSFAEDSTTIIAQTNVKRFQVCFPEIATLALGGTRTAPRLYFMMHVNCFYNNFYENIRWNPLPKPFLNTRK